MTGSDRRCRCKPVDWIGTLGPIMKRISALERAHKEHGRNTWTMRLYRWLFPEVE